MPTTNAADRVLSAVAGGAPWTLVGGKGGVGKTTIAAALAIEIAESGENVLVISVDPAHSLGDSLGVTLGPEPRDVRGVPKLRALEVDAERERQRWLERHREPLAELLEAGTYLARDEVEALLALALPGADELASLLLLAEIAHREDTTRLVIDTAPTGHALRLLGTPRAAAEWAVALEVLDSRRRAVVNALTRGTGMPADPVRAFLDTLAADIERLARRLTDPASTRCLLVTTAEPMVLAESERYLSALTEARIFVPAFAVNRVSGEVPVAADIASRAGVPAVYLPLLRTDPRGIDGLRRFARAASPDSAAATSAQASLCAPPSPDPASLRLGAWWRPPAGRRLYLVAGKGGVGKTTVASALAAMLAADFEVRTLLLGIDPAGSIGDAWNATVTDVAKPAPGTPGLMLRQLDAHAAWDAFRASESEGLAGMLSELVGGDSGELAGRIVDLVPPGLDELIALAELVRLADEPAYDVIVLDTAPTGHFVRLLEAPAVARTWAHAILRLMLRYRAMSGLGEPAERVLRFAREVKRLEDLLRDPERTMLVIVALPEALGVSESERLLERLREMHVDPGLLLVNRLLSSDATVDSARIEHARALLALRWRPPAAAAPALDDGPRGSDALLAFGRSWRMVSPEPAEETAA